MTERDKLQDNYSALLKLENQGYVKSYYEFRCAECLKSSKNLIERFNMIPEDIKCEFCGTVQPMLENSFIIFKTKEDGHTKIEIKMDGIYIDGVNITNWMDYILNGGNIPPVDYVKSNSGR